MALIYVVFFHLHSKYFPKTCQRCMLHQLLRTYLPLIEKRNKADHVTSHEAHLQCFHENCRKEFSFS